MLFTSIRSGSLICTVHVGLEATSLRLTGMGQKYGSELGSERYRR